VALHHVQLLANQDNKYKHILVYFNNKKLSNLNRKCLKCITYINFNFQQLHTQNFDTSQNIKPLILHSFNTIYCIFKSYGIPHYLNIICTTCIVF